MLKRTSSTISSTSYSTEAINFYGNKMADSADSASIDDDGRNKNLSRAKNIKKLAKSKK